MPEAKIRLRAPIQDFRAVLLRKGAGARQGGYEQAEPANRAGSRTSVADIPLTLRGRKSSSSWACIRLRQIDAQFRLSTA